MHSNPAPHIGQVHPGNQPAQERAESTGHEERPFFGGMPVQAKLEVSPPDDPHEREADAVADVVMRSPDPSAPPEMPGGAGAFAQRDYAGAPAMAVQRSCAACDAEDMVQRSTYAGAPAEGVQRKCAQCDMEGESPVQRKCEQCGPEDKVQRSAYAGGLTDLVQRKCALCEAQDDRPVQRKCETCEKEEMVQRSPYSSVTGRNVIERDCDECKIGEATKEENDEEAETETIGEEAQPEETGGGDAGGTVSPKAAPGGAGPASSGFESALGASKGGGHPLPADVRANMEGRFAQDFSHVRVHQGAKAAGMAASINAQAFTHGSDIYFNQNKFDGRSDAGKRLLAHELTHVVQQTGAAPIQPKVQRAEEVKIGNWAHHNIQAGMRGKDKNLITEAGIPGATRHGAKINNAGFADLYKADGHVVSAVQAEIRGAGGDKDDVDYTYKGFMQSGVRANAMKQNANAIKRGPKYTAKTDTWDWSPNFPDNFWIGEIKPLFLFDFPGSAGTLSGAYNQQSHYIEGFQEFVKQVYKDTNRPGKTGSKAPAKISGHVLDLDPLIPDAINYKKFDSQYNQYGKDAILKKDTKQRVWIYNVGHGIAVYFLINDPYAPPKYPEHIENQLKQLDPLLKDLRKKKPDMNPVLGTKRIQKKDEKTDWDAAHKKWEEKRKSWAGGHAGVEKPKKFLKEQAKGVFKRGKVDKELKITSSADQAKKLKQVKDIRFWSGLRGRIFGALRFKFSKTFDRVEALFEKVRDKFRKHKQKAETLKSGSGVFDGWKKVATKVIIRLAVKIFQDMVSIAFEGFVKCMNGILGVIVKKYEKGLEEKADEILKELRPQCCEVMGFKEMFDKEVEKHEEEIKMFTDAMETIQQWREILDKVEIAVRLGVQIMSCGAPPALGCLWGLVAQLGISAGLSLLSRTDYFETNIARPAAQALMDAIVGEKLHNFMIDLLEGTPLKPYLAEAEGCQRMKKGSGGGMGAIGAGLDKINPNDPAVAKARKEWEAEHKDEILADLNKVFKKGDKAMTEEDFKSMVDALKKSGKKPEELKRLLETGKETASGQIDFDKAFKAVSRKIDHDKAKRTNPRYEKAIGWKPELFQPGATDASSEEFANAVYDLQESMGEYADGIAGPGTTQKVYEKKGLEKDQVYKNAKALEASEKAEKAKAKLLKEIENFYKIKEVQDAMAKTYPSDDEIRKELNTVNWDAVPNGGARFLQRSYGALLLMKTDAGSRMGGAAKVADLLYEGVQSKVVVDVSNCWVLDDIRDWMQDPSGKGPESFIRVTITTEGKAEKPAYFMFSGEKAGTQTNLTGVFLFWRFKEFDK
ncbi:DUF4157 domain-containing protein [Chitinophaga sp. NPDC101104]|uniref:eCIS core domain-containing protein n=1 Tax=Chitinophaga sp. NPDC101104 TaxID=3390561 RepID=UPI003D03EE42